jgi:hypothetical protein
MKLLFDGELQYRCPEIIMNNTSAHSQTQRALYINNISLYIFEEAIHTDHNSDTKEQSNTRKLCKRM